MFSRRSFLALAVGGALALTATACGNDDDSGSGATTTAGGPTTTAGAATTAGSATTAAAPTTTGEPVTLRLGYFPNVTHAPAIVGVKEGIFEDALGDNVTLETSRPSTPARRRSRRSSPTPSTPPSSAPTRPSTPSPSPTARPCASSPGPPRAARSWSPSRRSPAPAHLEGKKIATPQLGNTQDVALRAWLKEQGFETDDQGGGDVSIVPQENAQTLDDLQGRRHRRRLGARALGHPAHPGGRRPRCWSTSATCGPRASTSPPTSSCARSSSRSTPTSVKQLLEGQVEPIDWINANPDEAEAIANAGIEKLTEQAAGPRASSTPRGRTSTFTDDPIAASLQKSADDAIEASACSKPVDLDGHLRPRRSSTRCSRPPARGRERPLMPVPRLQPGRLGDRAVSRPGVTAGPSGSIGAGPASALQVLIDKRNNGTATA